MILLLEYTTQRARQHWVTHVAHALHSCASRVSQVFTHKGKCDASSFWVWTLFFFSETPLWPIHVSFGIAIILLQVCDMQIFLIDFPFAMNRSCLSPATEVRIRWPLWSVLGVKFDCDRSPSSYPCHCWTGRIRIHSGSTLVLILSPLTTASAFVGTPLVAVTPPNGIWWQLSLLSNNA